MTPTELLTMENRVQAPRSLTILDTSTGGTIVFFLNNRFGLNAKAVVLLKFSVSFFIINESPQYGKYQLLRE